MYTPPEYVEATDSIENLITAIKNSLQLWLDIHTDPEAWAQEWNIDDDWHCLLENQPIIKNNYFEFDLKDAVVSEWCKDYALRQTDVYRCKFCGSYWDSGFEECDCQGQEYNEDDYELVTEDNIEDYIEWSKEIEISPDYISESIIEDAMINQGFAIYQEALSSTIQGVVEDVQQALKQFEDAETNEDLLFAALNASSILHVNGNILQDYGENTGLQYETVCLYRDNGITALFDKEDIESFINSDQM